MPEFDSFTALSRTGPEPLAALLSAGSPPAGLWHQDEMAAVFRHQLAAPLLVDLGGFAPTMAPRLEALAAAQVSAFQCFADLLRQPNPPIEVLELLKDFSKTHANQPESPLPKDIATALYYASIAAALVRHKSRISKLPDADLARGLRWAGQQPWLDDETQQLLACACAALTTPPEGAPSPS